MVIILLSVYMVTIYLSVDNGHGLNSFVSVQGYNLFASGQCYSSFVCAQGYNSFVSGQWS